MGIIYKVWLRQHRMAWNNDGGSIPRGMRSAVKRSGIKAHTVTLKNIGERVPRGHWVVKIVGSHAAYCFSPAEMKRLYSRVPL